MLTKAKRNRKPTKTRELINSKTEQNFITSSRRIPAAFPVTVNPRNRSPAVCALHQSAAFPGSLLPVFLPLLPSLLTATYHPHPLLLVTFRVFSASLSPVSSFLDTFVSCISNQLITP